MSAIGVAEEGENSFFIFLHLLQGLPLSFHFLPPRQKLPYSIVSLGLHVLEGSVQPVEEGLLFGEEQFDAAGELSQLEKFSFLPVWEPVFEGLLPLGKRGLGVLALLGDVPFDEGGLLLDLAPEEVAQPQVRPPELAELQDATALAECAFFVDGVDHSVGPLYLADVLNFPPEYLVQGVLLNDFPRPFVSEEQLPARGLTGLPEWREGGQESVPNDRKVPLILGERQSQILGVLVDF